jgi:PAS domain S-box-containing protein
MLNFESILFTATVTLSLIWVWMLALLFVVLFGYFLYHELHRKRIWRDLEKKFTYMEGVFNGDDAAVCLRDRDRRLLMWNTKFADSLKDFSGVDAKKGMRAEDYVPAELFESYGPQREKMMRTFDGVIQVSEFEVPFPDGSSIWLETRWTPCTVNGECVAVTEVSRDITIRKNQEKELQHSRRRHAALLQNSTEAMGCFEIEPPMPMSLNVDDQLDYIYKYASVVEANQAWAEFAGFSSEDEMINLTLDQVVPRSIPGNVDTLRKLIEFKYNLRDLKTFEPDNEQNIHIILNNAFGDISDGHLVRCWFSAVDITEKEVAVDQLRDAEAKYRSVVEICNEAIFISQDRRIKYCNPFATKMMGYSLEELGAKDFLNFIHPDDRDLVKNEVQARLSGEKPINQYTIRILTRDNEVRTVVVNSAAIEWDGAPAVITLVTDVTELKWLQQRLNEQNERVARMERIGIFGELTGAIAHELNQPLTGILSNAQAAEIILNKENQLPVEMMEILTDIITDTKRAGDVIRNLRDLYGEQKGKFNPLDVNLVVEQICTILKNELINEKVCLLKKCDPGLPMVKGNSAQIQQVLLNLLKNALQALLSNPENGKLITIRTSFDSSFIRVSVTDNGPGIDPAKLASMFKPLASWKSGGMGLGLAISDSIIENHSGRMFAMNDPEGGAEVGFELPVKTDS